MDKGDLKGWIMWMSGKRERISRTKGSDKPDYRVELSGMSRTLKGAYKGDI